MNGKCFRLIAMPHDRPKTTSVTERHINPPFRVNPTIQDTMRSDIRFKSETAQCALLAEEASSIFLLKNRTPVHNFGHEPVTESRVTHAGTGTTLSRERQARASSTIFYSIVAFVDGSRVSRSLGLVALLPGIALQA